MLINYAKLTISRKMRRSFDRKLRRTAVPYRGFLLVRLGPTWAIMRDGRRGLLKAIAGDYLTCVAAMKAVDRRLGND